MIRGGGVESVLKPTIKTGEDIGETGCRVAGTELHVRNGFVTDLIGLCLRLRLLKDRID